MFLIEIYKSVQGESSFAGLPCIFVRLAGCNLRCSWCDSEYTFNGGYRQSLDEVEAAVAALAPVRLVEFTGGEPMLQERELIPLMERLLARDYTLMIEPELRRRAEELEARELEFYAAGQRAGALRADLPVRWVSNTVYGLMATVRESLRHGDVARRDLPRLLRATFLEGAGPERGGS